MKVLLVQDQSQQHYDPTYDYMYDEQIQDQLQAYSEEEQQTYGDHYYPEQDHNAHHEHSADFSQEL